METSEQIDWIVRLERKVIKRLCYRKICKCPETPRDLFIGWSHEQREARLHLIVNNSRFLILPWVQVKYLASSVLSILSHQLASDWVNTYSYRPVLLETFVERDRFRGTCYKAANWIHVGCTQGRGKLDRHTLRQKPVKEIFLFPLSKNFRIILSNGITE